MDKKLVYRKVKGSKGKLVEADLRYLNFCAYKLEKGNNLLERTDSNESAIVILSGLCHVDTSRGKIKNAGSRMGIFERKPPYVVLLPRNTEFEIIPLTDLHVSISSTEAEKDGKIQLILPDYIKWEERGSGKTKRYIYDLVPEGYETKLMLYEVFTPEGNWSSYPPHKHDTENQPHESLLEETYYFQFNPKEGFAFQWVCNDDLSIDEAYAVRNGDLIMVPEGYHTLVTAPGYECYCHCVMAGPTREWNFKVHPDYKHLMNWSKK